MSQAVRSLSTLNILRRILAKISDPPQFHDPETEGPRLQVPDIDRAFRGFTLSLRVKASQSREHSKEKLFRVLEKDVI